MSIRVGEGTRVTLTYRLQTSRGDVLEERTPENPFILEFGKGQTLPAVESVIRGKTEGFEASIGVAAKEAYGEFDDELVTSVPLSTFPQPNDVQVGMKYSTVGPLGEEIIIRVVEVDEENATVDGNHPLAGLDIEIDLKILEIEAVESSKQADVVDDYDYETDDGDEDGGEGAPEGGGRRLH
jgi:FKBP-type peptidyl-prolyl cis-trans isomerase SlyD